MKDFTELASMLIAGGIGLTFLLVVAQNPQGVSQSLQGAAGASSTFFGTFLKQGA